MHNELEKVKKFHIKQHLYLALFGNYNMNIEDNKVMLRAVERYIHATKLFFFKLHFDPLLEAY